MKPIRPGAPKRLFFFAFALFSLRSFSVHAHTVVLSEYTLQYEDNNWTLYFKQKTSHLRDAIYFSNPGLKGINLNGEVFLAATAKHIVSNIALTHQGKQLRISPKQMHYGGLRFESVFQVEGLSGDPDYLSIKTDGFDSHEHSVKLFRTTIEEEGYLHYFNQEQRLATFDFETHNYSIGEITSDKGNNIVFYALLLLVAGGVAIGLFYKKRGW